MITIVAFFRDIQLALQLDRRIVNYMDKYSEPFGISSKKVELYLVVAVSDSIELSDIP